VAEPLEGERRPGHFEGVATVVTKLFDAAQPDRAYFGRKDAQQLAVVRALARDLLMQVEVVDCPIVRAADGLALSSRNAYLDSRQREAATCLYRALRRAADAYRDGERSPEALRGKLLEVLEGEPQARTDYAEVVDPATFVAPGPLAVLAVRIGRARLIDNHLLSEPLGA
jgi:pantoate--beta-alanine ligase